MSLHSDTLSWFQANQALLLLLHAACLADNLWCTIVEASTLTITPPILIIRNVVTRQQIGKPWPANLLKTDYNKNYLAHILCCPVNKFLNSLTVCRLASSEHCNLISYSCNFCCCSCSKIVIYKCEKIKFLYN